MDEVTTTARKARGKTGRQHDPAGTQKNIIEVAMREFANAGLAGARIDDIAAKTSTSKRMIYYYFGDKDGLYLRCLEEAYKVVRTGEVGLKLDHLPPVDALRQLVEFTFDHHHDREDFIRMVMIENIHHGVFVERSNSIHDLNATAIGNLEKIYARGVTAGDFRDGLLPIDLHWHISALCFFNISNRATFSKIFNIDLDSRAAQAARRAQVVDMILRYVQA